MNFIFIIINLVILRQTIGWWKEVNILKRSCAPLNPYLLAAEEGKRLWSTILVIGTLLHILGYANGEL